MHRRKFLNIAGFVLIASIFVKPIMSEITDYIKTVSKKLIRNFGLKENELFIIADTKSQQMYLISKGKIIKIYIISTSKYGCGSEFGSNKTPLGTHRIKEMIGEGANPGRIFRGRKDTGRTAVIYTDKTDLKQDDVTTRIMWLDGQESGKNRGGNVDSHRRYIYIHGTPEEGLLGKPASHGCIRMKNSEVIELFKIVRKGTLVEII